MERVMESEAPGMENVFMGLFVKTGEGFRKGGLAADDLAGHRMPENEGTGMEGEPVDGIELRTVFVVARHRMAEVGGMDADLVLPAGFQLELGDGEGVFLHLDRPEGSESKLNTVSDGLKVLRTILRLYVDYKPFQFFGIIALILIALAVGFFIPVFSDYLHTGLVERFPTLIVCGFSAISGIISLFTGLILSTLKNRERREFEFRLQSIAQWKSAK